MKRVLLVTAACLSLSVPALAQNSGMSTQSKQQMQSQPQQQMQNQPQQQMGTQGQNQSGNSQMGTMGNQQQAQMIDPSSLSKQQIQEIQMNLNKAGFDAKNVDGIWGDETQRALKNYQQIKNLPGNGEINQQTLAALGVNTNQSQTVGSSTQPTNGQMQNGQMQNGQMQKGQMQNGQMQNGQMQKDQMQDQNSNGSSGSGGMSNQK